VKKLILSLAGATLAAASFGSANAQAAGSNNVSFPIVVSSGAAKCLPNAKGMVTITDTSSNVQTMHVEVEGLPKNSDFDFFNIQVPNAPFGLSWYLGDISTDGNGVGVADFIGRFSVETFIVAPGVASAPAVFPGGTFPDATKNPQTAPVQIYHLGLWFDSAAEAIKAGCAGTETPFNGEHNAGIQVINTSNFADANGPVRQIE